MPKLARMLTVAGLLVITLAPGYAQSNSDQQNRAETKTQVMDCLRYYRLDAKATADEIDQLTELRLKLQAPAASLTDRQAAYRGMFPILYRLLDTKPLPSEQAINSAAQFFAQNLHLLLTSGSYKPVTSATTPPGQLGHIEKVGRGPIPMILIPDLGSDWTIYKSFMERNAGRYTMYAVTAPGFGGTPTPPRPESYAAIATPWLDNAELAIIKLIEKNKLDKPLVVGVLTGGHLAARLALDYPDKIRGAVLLDSRSYVPYRSLSFPDKPVSLEERRNILTTRPTAMGILQDLSPQVMLSREASEQLVKNMSPQQRQSLLYSNLHDIERGRALFINNTYNTDSRTFRYNIELNGVDLSEDMKKLKAPLLSIVALHDDNSPGQGGVSPSQWNEIKLRFPQIPLTVVKFEGTRGYIFEEAPKEFDKAIEAFLAGKPVEGKSRRELASRPSPRASVSQVVGATEVAIDYGRPRVNNRMIWGELVPYNRVWRAGANEATTITFSDDVTVEGQKLSAGSYNFFIIPTETEWTIIFNKVNYQWGHFYYNAEFDALRVKVNPQPADHQEWLSYSFDVISPASAQMHIHWEKVKAPIKIEVGAAKNPS